MKTNKASESGRRRILTSTPTSPTGYYIAKWLKLSEKDTHTISIEVEMQNSGLGSQLASKHFTVLAATPCAISALYHCLIGSALAAIWSRRT